MPVRISKNRVDMGGTQMRWSKGADVASTTILILGTDGNYFDITGTTTITGISAITAGTIVKLHFDSPLTLTYNSTSFILPGTANITAATGDEAEFVEYGVGVWRCTNYTKASGAPVIAPGVSGNVLTSDGTNWGSAAAGGSGLWKTTSTGSVSTNGNWDITGITTTMRIIRYNMYWNSGNRWRLTTSTNGGTSYDAGVSDYAFTVQGQNGTSGITASGSEANNHIPLVGWFNTFVIYQGTEVLELWSPETTKYPQIMYEFKGTQYPVATIDNDQVVNSGSGTRRALAYVDAIRYNNVNSVLTTWDYLIQELVL